MNIFIKQKFDSFLWKPIKCYKTTIFVRFQEEEKPFLSLIVHHFIRTSQAPKSVSHTWNNKSQKSLDSFVFFLVNMGDCKDLKLVSKRRPNY